MPGLLSAELAYLRYVESLKARAFHDSPCRAGLHYALSRFKGMSVTLGAEPHDLTVILVRGADFRCVLELAALWPSTAQVSLAIETREPPGTVTWTATRSGTDMSFNVDVVEVNALIAQNPREARLWHVDGTLKVLWAKGQVKVSG